MNYHFGHGLVGLINPVTKEFNHDAVIKRRGGRDSDREDMGSLEDYYIPHILGAMNSLLGQDRPTNYVDFQDSNGDPKRFDRYDATSFAYGWAIALTDSDDDATQSDCFISLFELITQVEYFFRDLDRISETFKVFDLTVYSPTLIFNNGAAAYE